MPKLMTLRKVRARFADTAISVNTALEPPSRKQLTVMSASGAEKEITCSLPSMTTLFPVSQPTALPSISYME